MIRVYRNLHKNCYSIQEKFNNTWKVIEYSHEIYLENCSFKIYENGRQKVIKEKRKNVHAFICGERLNLNLKQINKNNLVHISYNPYYSDSFFIKKTKEKIKSAKFIIINKDEILAYIL